MQLAKRKEEEKMKFTKMHGAGNDYVYINGFTEKIVVLKIVIYNIVSVEFY